MSILGIFKRTNRLPGDVESSSHTISEDQFVALTGTNPAPEMLAGDDRREAPRVAMGRRAMLRVAHSEAPPISVLVRDLSILGIGLLMDQPLNPGDIVWIYIPKAEDANLDVALSGSVVRCDAGGFEKSAFVVAATFLEEVPPPLPAAPAFTDVAEEEIAWAPQIRPGSLFSAIDYPAAQFETPAKHFTAPNPPQAPSDANDSHQPLNVEALSGVAGVGADSAQENPQASIDQAQTENSLDEGHTDAADGSAAESAALSVEPLEIPSPEEAAAVARKQLLRMSQMMKKQLLFYKRVRQRLHAHQIEQEEITLQINQIERSIRDLSSMLRNTRDHLPGGEKRKRRRRRRRSRQRSAILAKLQQNVEG